MADMEGTFTFAGVTFGGDSRLVVESHTANMGDVRTEDADNPFGDGAFPGRDQLGVGTWEWELSTDADDFEDDGALNALDLWEQLHAAWRVAVRDREPGKLYPLTYTALGRTRRVYGRPRRIDAPVGDILAMQGQARGAAQFTLMDPYTYDEEIQTHEVGRIAPAAGGGTLIPAQIPFQIGTAPGSRHGVVQVGGTAPTPFIATFHGPVTNPYLLGPDWAIHLEGTVDQGQSVSVDTRERKITRGNTDVRGALRRGSTLGGRLEPGTTEVTYGGTDATNTSRVVLTWRPAYYSL